MRDPRVELRFVPPHPDELRGRVARQRAVPRERDESREPELALDLLAFGGGALIVPEDRRPEHPLLGVECDEPVHLAREPDPGHVVRGQRGERCLRRAPPELGILLCPAGPRRLEPVALLGPRDDLAGRERARAP